MHLLQIKAGLWSPRQLAGRCLAAMLLTLLLCGALQLIGGSVAHAAPAPSHAGATSAALPIPAIPGVSAAQGPQQVALSLQILALLTVLTLAPAILIMTTAFTRIVIVLSFLRSALGAQNIPPNQVMIGLSLFLTFFIMARHFARSTALLSSPTSPTNRILTLPWPPAKRRLAVL